MTTLLAKGTTTQHRSKHSYLNQTFHHETDTDPITVLIALAACNTTLINS